MHNPEVHTRPEGVTGCAPRGGSLGACGVRRRHKLKLPQTTHIHVTNVNIFTTEHVYRYAILLLVVCVCLQSVRIDAWVSLRVTFVGRCVTSMQ